MMYNVKVEFNTNYYQNEYGKRPSGRGYWFFSYNNGQEVFQHYGLYSEAKEFCKDHIRASYGMLPYPETVRVKVET